MTEARRAMKFAYADPPYLGCGSLYAKHHPEALKWDDPEAHRSLIGRLCEQYPDGWVLSLHEPSLRTILRMCPDDVRVASWVKPFASFKETRWTIFFPAPGSWEKSSPSEMERQFKRAFSHDPRAPIHA